MKRESIGHVLAGGALAVALTVLAGWIFDVPRLRSFFPGTVEMKILTAVTFAIAAIAVIARMAGRSVASRVAAGIVAGAAVVSLAEYATGRELWSELITIDVPDPVETVHRGRMARNTAIAFLALALAIAVPGRRRIESLLAVGGVSVGALVALQVILGYLFQARELRGGWETTPMALPTAIGFALLSASVGWMHRHAPPLSLLTGNRSSALVARIVVPAAIVIPVAVATLRVHGERAQLFSGQTGVALMTLFTVISLLVAVFWGTSRQLRSEEAAEGRQEQLRESIATLERIGAELDLDTVVGITSESLSHLMRSDGAAVALLQHDRLHVRGASGCLSGMQGRLLAPGDTQVGAALSAGRAIEVGPTGPGDPLGCPAGSFCLLMPLLHRTTIGCLTVVRMRGRFTESDIDLLRLLAPPIAASISHSSEFQSRQLFMHEQAAEIATLQQQFSAFMENTPTSAAIKDPTGHYVFVNRQFGEIFGLDVESVIGRTADDLFYAELSRRIRSTEEAVRRDRTSRGDTIAFGSGSGARWVLDLEFPIETADGRIFVGSVGVDITELKRAERTIAELNATLEGRVAERTEQLERANAELEAFSYSVSHDLRAPLRAVDGYAQLIEEDFGDRLDAEGRRFLDVIRSESRRMASLIDDLLAFSRIGRQALAHGIVDMNTLVQEVVRDVAGWAGEKRIEIACDQLPASTGDRSAIRQVVINLVSNAVKYSKPDGPVRIGIGGRLEGEQNVYWVRDEGIGFDMRYADKLFQVFQRLHPEEAIEGTGIGLAIVERVIARHGGRVWAEGAVGKGATFYFTLPGARGAAYQEAS